MCRPTISDCAQQQCDVLFVVDVSNSISEDDFMLQRLFLKEIVQCFNMSEDVIRVAFVTFARIRYIHFFLNAHLDDPDTAVDVIMNFTRPTGADSMETNTAKAFRVARNMIFKEVNGDRIIKVGAPYTVV